MGLAGVCLLRDEVEKAERIASRALEEVDGILFTVEEPADSIVVRGVTGTMEFVRTPTICAEIMAGSSGRSNGRSRPSGPRSRATAWREESCRRRK